MTTFVSERNEFPVPNTLRDRTNLYRGGVRFELRRFHATLEEGGTTFKNDQNLYQTRLDQLRQFDRSDLRPDTRSDESARRLRHHGTSTYTKALFTANAVSWLDLYGQFSTASPSSNVNYQEDATGNLYLPTPDRCSTRASSIWSPPRRSCRTPRRTSARRSGR